MQRERGPVRHRRAYDSCGIVRTAIIYDDHLCGIWLLDEPFMNLSQALWETVRLVKRGNDDGERGLLRCVVCCHHIPFAVYVLCCTIIRSDVAKTSRIGREVQCDGLSQNLR